MKDEGTFVAVVTYPRVEPRSLAGQCLQGPRTPQKVKRDGYGWTFDLAQAWTFPSKNEAEAKCRIVERHMTWGEGTMGAETVEFFRECLEERQQADPGAAS